jgi:hypothetical protein
LLRVRAEAVADSEHRQANVWATATRKPVAASFTGFPVVRGSGRAAVRVTEEAHALVSGSGCAEARVTEADRAVLRGSGRAAVRVTEEAQAVVKGSECAEVPVT